MPDAYVMPLYIYLLMNLFLGLCVLGSRNSDELIFFKEGFKVKHILLFILIPFFYITLGVFMLAIFLTFSTRALIASCIHRSSSLFSRIANLLNRRLM